jgi:hypothetical protein
VKVFRKLEVGRRTNYPLAEDARQQAQEANLVWISKWRKSGPLWGVSFSGRWHC